MSINKYTDLELSPRTNAYADRRLLERAKYNNIAGQFGQQRTLPKKATQTIKFRRYNRLPEATVPLLEGVSPDGSVFNTDDYTATVKQYGDFIRTTDVIQDTHEDPVLRESMDILGDQAVDTVDLLRCNVLKAGTFILRIGAAGALVATRAEVRGIVTADNFRGVVRLMDAQMTKKITEIHQAGPNISTIPVPACYVAICHTDLKPDLDRLSGFTPVHKYPSQQGIMQGEVGSFYEIRFVCDNHMIPWGHAGAAKGTTGYITDNDTNLDVYPIIILGRDAYGLVPLGGKNAVSTLIHNPRASDTDPLAQRGSAGWKTWHAAVILNQNWMYRIETAALG